MVNGLLLFLLFFLSFYAINEKFKVHEAEKLKKKSNQINLSKENLFQRVLKKVKFLKAKEEFLSKQGFPLKLHANEYYLLKVLLVSIFFLSSSINYGNILVTLIFSFIGYFFIDIYIYLHKKTRDTQIRNDLLNVSNTLSLQLSANIMLKDSLKKQFEICQNKDLKCALLKLSTKYELSEYDIEIALKELKESFDLNEIDMFCNCLKQYHHISNIIELLENLSETLKIQYFKKIRDATNMKVLYITVGVVIALGNIVMITFYPLFVSLGNGFQAIFN